MINVIALTQFAFLTLGIVFHVDAALSSIPARGGSFCSYYWVLQQIQPGTFTFADDFSPNSAIYFSFVTLATLGYGDIVPRTDVARGLSHS